MGRDIKINWHDPAEGRPVLEAMFNDLKNLRDRLNVTPAILTIGTTAEDIGHLAFNYTIAGVEYMIAADAPLICSSGAGGAGSGDTINVGAVAGLWWGAWIVQVNAAGTVTTLCNTGVDGDQAYSTEAAAVAALPDPIADNVVIGYFTVKSKTSATKFTLGTQDLTSGSADNTAVHFFTGTPLAELETLNE